MRGFLVIAFALLATPVMAQAPAPAPGSGGGGPVGASIPQPTAPTGKTPPGTPDDQTASGRVARDAAGTQVIGKTATPPTALPGNTGGVQSGPRQ